MTDVFELVEGEGEDNTPSEETLENIIEDLEQTVKEHESGEAHTQAEEDDPQEPDTEEGVKVEPSAEEEMSLKEALVEEIVEQAASIEEDAAYTERQIEEGIVFLEKYGIDTSEMSHYDVFVKLEKIQEAKEESAQVLSRGRVLDGIDRLLSYVPEGFKGGFFGDTDVDVARAEALGWAVFLDDRAGRASSTGVSDGRVKLGDQILMITPEEKYIGHLLAKAERFKIRREARDPNRPAQGDEILGADPLFPIMKL